MTESSATIWIELSFLVPNAWEEYLGSVLADELASTVAIDAPPQIPARLRETHVRVRGYVLEKLIAPSRLEDVRQTLLAAARNTGAPELRELTVHFRRIAQSAIPTGRRWRPFRLGRVCIGQTEPAKKKPGDIFIELEPGGAFGDGDHATTRLCLRLLQSWVRPGQGIVDIGSGKGILSVTAAKLGAVSVLGVDPDSMAVVLSNELAQRNGVAGSCRFEKGVVEDLEGRIEELPDGIVANLYRDLLIAHAGVISRMIRRDGWVIVSGFRCHQESGVIGAMENAGLRIAQHLVRGSWVALVLTPLGR